MPNSTSPSGKELPNPIFNDPNDPAGLLRRAIGFALNREEVGDDRDGQVVRFRFHDPPTAGMIYPTKELGPDV